MTSLRSRGIESQSGINEDAPDEVRKSCAVGETFRQECLEQMGENHPGQIRRKGGMNVFHGLTPIAVVK